MPSSSELLGSITAWCLRPDLKVFGGGQRKRISRAKINVREFPRSAPALHVAAGTRPDPERTICSLCTHEQLDSPRFRRWAAALGETWRAHRKLWELAYICESLEQRGLLAPGKRGLGFAVGLERLPSFFASRGCQVLASDLPAEDDRNRKWASSGQWAPGLEALNRYGLCPPEQFRRLVTFRPIDMNEIPDDLQGFDFTWSTCSFEHCGTLELGLRFLERQMQCLKPGGVAVHTTEFNLSSNDRTLAKGSCVIYRLKDIEGICGRLRQQGHEVEPLDLDPGSHELDRFIDGKPYSSAPHLRLDLKRYAATSIGLIIRKSAAV
jgi:hypothetical protein